MRPRYTWATASVVIRDSDTVAKRSVGANRVTDFGMVCYRVLLPLLLINMLTCPPFNQTGIIMSWRIIKKIVLIFLSVIGILFLIFASHLGYNYFSGNVHSVIPGEIYRTAQLDKAGLEKYTKQFGIKTIINLRGVWKNDHWYQVESQFAKKNNINYYPMQFSAYDLPSKQALRNLVKVLETAPKPLMFHCEGGADRTGMAGAISIILFDKNPSITQIERQASWHYNAISGRTVGYQVMRNYFAWLKVNHYHSSKQRFLEWLDLPVAMKPYHGWFVV